MANDYKHGDYNVVCDRSGFKCKRSECRETWDGYLVRKDFWEPRHPQDFVRSTKDDPEPVPDARPRTRVYIQDDEQITTDDL